MQRAAGHGDHTVWCKARPLLFNCQTPTAVCYQPKMSLTQQQLYSVTDVSTAEVPQDTLTSLSASRAPCFCRLSQDAVTSSNITERSSMFVCFSPPHRSLFFFFSPYLFVCVLESVSQLTGGKSHASVQDSCDIKVIMSPVKPSSCHLLLLHWLS